MNKEDAIKIIDTLTGKPSSETLEAALQLQNVIVAEKLGILHSQKKGGK